jgi:hypothetical protein
MRILTKIHHSTNLDKPIKVIKKTKDLHSFKYFDRNYYVLKISDQYNFAFGDDVYRIQDVFAISYCFQQLQLAQIVLEIKLAFLKQGCIGSMNTNLYMM